MFLLGLAIPISYIAGYSGMYILGGWIILSCLLPFFFLRQIELSLGHWLGLAFLGYATLGLAWTPIWQQGVWDLWNLYVLAGCFLLGASRDLNSFFVGFALGMGINLIVALAWMAGHDPIMQVQSTHPAGLFVNPDMFGETAALITISLIAFGLYWPLPLTIPIILLSGSRAAIIGLFAALALWLFTRYRWKGAICAALLSIPIIIGVAHRGYDDSIALRVAMWEDTFDGLTIQGRGPGSFFTLYPAFAKRTDTMLTRPESAHNDFLEMAFEFGLGVLPLAALFAFALASSDPARYSLACFLAIAFFSFPIRIPAEGILGMVALGRLCAGRNLAWRYWLHRRSAISPRTIQNRSLAVSMEPVYPGRAGI